jgi:hypothetical protein
MRGWKVTALQNWGVDGRCGKIGMCMSEILDDLFSGGVSLNPCRTDPGAIFKQASLV